jgi:hypothetical protein
MRNDSRDTEIRELRVFIDGKEIADIRFGGEVSHGAEPGEHTVRVYNNLNAKQISFSIRPGETIRFSAGNENAGCLFGIFQAMGQPAMSTFLERLDDSSSRNKNNES